tara:strand:+ start:959 stop:1132 length:174 start_codon:yes stop_codon:yes gene_type:complete
MDNWDKDVLALTQEAHLTFKGAADGEINFCARKASSTVASVHATDLPGAEFSWEGQD